MAIVVTLLIGTLAARFDPNTLIFYVSYAAVGAFLAIRRPENPIGWILIGIAVAFLLTTPPPGIDAGAIAAGRPTVRDVTYAWLWSWSGRTLFLGYFALTMIFPTGHLPAGRWRRPVVALLVIGLVNATISAVAPTIAIDVGAGPIAFKNPVAVLPGLGAWEFLATSGIQDVIVLCLMLGGVGSIIVRFRRSRGLVRLQLSWLVTAVTFLLVALMGGSALIGALGDDAAGLAWAPAILAYPSIPIAIAVAVLRYRLFDIDRIISRTLAYSAVTAILGAVFLGVIVGLQWVLAPFTKEQTIGVAASTLAVFALFQPVLRRVRSAVDRRFDRARYDADLTVRTFAARLRGDIDLAAVSAEIVGTASAAVRPTAASIWLRGP
jgi:hypothetical protein